MGIPQGYPDYVLHKMVTVMRNGEEVKISKRAGSYVTVRDLIEWSNGQDDTCETIRGCLEAGVADWPAHFTRGRDAVRFFLLSRKADTEFVFDVDLALKQNDENPVYYVQYAHARICSIFESWGARTGKPAWPSWPAFPAYRKSVGNPVHINFTAMIFFSFSCNPSALSASRG